MTGCFYVMVIITCDICESSVFLDKSNNEKKGGEQVLLSNLKPTRTYSLSESIQHCCIVALSTATDTNACITKEVFLSSRTNWGASWT